mgnify:CR=1 FL=1
MDHADGFAREEYAARTGRVLERAERIRMAVRGFLTRLAHRHDETASLAYLFGVLLTGLPIGAGVMGLGMRGAAGVGVGQPAGVIEDEGRSLVLVAEEARAAFQKVAELRGEIERIDGEIAAANAERDRLFAEQERIRQNLAAVPEGSDLQRRYLQTLAEQEDRLTALAQRLVELQAERDGAVKALDDYVATVTL